MQRTESFDPDCRLCPRLSRFLEEVRGDYPDYHARPVPPFGDPAAKFRVGHDQDRVPLSLLLQIAPESG
jgi:hypothetical protein